MQDVDISISKRLRDKVWQGLCLILGILAGLLAIWNFFFNSNALYLAVAEVVLTGFSIYIFFHVKKWPKITWQQYVYLLLFCLLVSYAVWSRPLSNALIVWPMFLPILCYLTLGIRVGLSVSLITLVLMLIILTLKVEAEGYQNTVSTRLNFFFCYLCIMGISHVYERNRRRIEGDLVNLAMTDTLTGVKNRLAFKQYLANFLKSHTLFGLMMIDIDHFKKVNDSYGHDVGDELLRQLTERIQNMSPQYQLFRHGGEEFCILLAGDKASLMAHAERIRATVAQQAFCLDERDIAITVSIGVAINEEVSSSSELIVIADQRMYCAKRQGRNCVVAEGELSNA
ncbi:Diguanylate cyclase DosC [Marinomonas aquimarina]|uniref:diguanylate cyclase n=1 Tax=Marinomonas aquimarina TaxID=295068 RepID=A0A1A8T5X1_9GAMM|nr:GGDEF domain-containing protein [Marinomonas aquimarina]SBS26998.1 Diguanylate cyclase DosC [Marinomonas aquimarina]